MKQNNIIQLLLVNHSENDAVETSNALRNSGLTLRPQIISNAKLLPLFKLPANLVHLSSYKEKDIGADKVFSDLTTAISIMQKDSAEYRCQKCGFNTNTHYWLCPGCNHWGSVKPSNIHKC